MGLRNKIIGGGAAAVTALSGIYGLATLHSHQGNEYKVLMNKGLPVSVTTEGLLTAWGVYDTVLKLPKGRQITTVADKDVNLRSKDGEEFIGGLRVEYKFRFGNTPQDHKRHISSLINNFNITNTEDFWDTNKVDPVEKTVNARAQTAAVEAFGTIATDEYQANMIKISTMVRTNLQKLMDDEGIPVEILSIDTNGVTPSNAVQERINRIASERRESERAQVIVDNSGKVKEAAAAEAEVVLAFTEALKKQGYSEELIATLNCQRLADRADRFALPFGTDCTMNSGGKHGVIIDPSKLTTAVPNKKTGTGPSVPVPQ